MYSIACIRLIPDNTKKKILKLLVTFGRYILMKNTFVSVSLMKVVINVHVRYGYNLAHIITATFSYMSVS